jgi:hypothetical protein
MLDKLTLADFADRVGEGFSLSHPEHAETLTLTEATAGRAIPPSGMRQSFSLVFLGESVTKMLGQGIYSLDHPALGRLDLFLVCIGPVDDGRFQYEAVFG